MAWVAAAIVAGSAITSYAGNKAASKASNASERAADASLAEQRRQFDLQRKDMYPYIQSGQQALNQLNILNKSPANTIPEYTPFQFDPSQITENPAYQFRLNQGMDAINRGSGAAGKRISGNRLLDLENYAQGLASTEYDNAYNRDYNRYTQEYGIGAAREADYYSRNQDFMNRLSSIAGIGQTSAANSGAAGSNMANAMSSIYGANAQNQANAANLQWGSMNNAVQGGIQNYMLYNYLQPQGAASPTWQSTGQYIYPGAR